VLLVPNRHNKETQDPFLYYGVEKNFTIKKLPVFDIIRFGIVGYVVTWLTFMMSAFWYLVRNQGGVVYGRDEAVLFIAKILGKKVIFESHTGQWNFFIRGLAAFKTPFVVISSGLSKFYKSKGIGEAQLFVAHDGVNLDAYTGDVDRAAVRDLYKVREEDFLVLYTGKLGGWKGMDTLLETSLKKEMESFVFVIAGGTTEEVEVLQRQYPKVRFLGRIEKNKIANLQRVADLLVIPNTAKDTISREYTSPLKIFEYMASGVPIVAADIPSLREVLSENTGFLFEADNSEALAEKILEVYKNKDEASVRAKRAQELVRSFSWKERAQHILKYIHG
jgi:glycosyltransferase involved in cell wall biosynthesis